MWALLTRRCFVVGWIMFTCATTAIAIDGEEGVKHPKGLLDSVLTPYIVSTHYELNKRRGFDAGFDQQGLGNFNEMSPMDHVDYDTPTEELELSLPAEAESFDYPELDDPEITFDAEDEDRLRKRSAQHKIIPVFQPLCPYARNIVNLDQRVYKQPSYEEISCQHPYSPTYESKKNKVCGGLGFTCIQKTRKIILVKRNRSDNNCFETESRTINHGCDCTWPRHIYGDIDHTL